MTEEGHRPDNADIGWTPLGEPTADEAASLAKQRAYIESAADTHDARVDLAKDPLFNSFRELMEARKAEFKHLEVPPELTQLLDKMVFERKIEKLGELKGEEPERAVGTAVMAMTDFLSANPDQNLADLSMTSAKAVAKATERNGVIPAPALGFVYEMFRLKAASQAAPAVAESGAGK